MVSASAVITRLMASDPLCRHQKRNGAVIFSKTRFAMEAVVSTVSRRNDSNSRKANKRPPAIQGNEVYFRGGTNFPVVSFVLP
jgi:hypothetical protein